MSTTYPVLRGVPIPEIDYRPKSPRGEPWPLATLKSGEMIFIPSRDIKPVSSHVSRVSKRIKARFVTRPVVMCIKGDTWQPCKPTDPGATSGVGVWRVK